MIEQLLNNKIFISSMSSLIISQIIKFIIVFMTEKKWSIERLFGDGGMPSSHSATVVSALTMTGLECGIDSPLFGVMAVVAFIVIHDANGVRYQSGIQAKAINEIRVILEKALNIPDKDVLNEFLGHTKLQIFFGSLLGLIIALSYYSITI